MDKKKDELERRINDFATRSFRDVADRDYIAARLACRYELIPQYLWSAQQAIEKYLKYLLLVNRIPAKVGHNLSSALELTTKLPFKFELHPKALEYIQHIATYGEYRYLDVSYHVTGHALLALDMTIWELRRYCQILDVRGKNLSSSEQKLLEEAQSKLARNKESPHKFRLHRGFLEQVIDNKDHPSRDALVWQNAYFSARQRKWVKVKDFLHVANSPLYLFPDMLEELLKYVYIPRELRTSYREHFKRILADPSKRP